MYKKKTGTGNTRSIWRINFGTQIASSASDVINNVINARNLPEFIFLATSGFSLISECPHTEICGVKSVDLTGNKPCAD